MILQGLMALMIIVNTSENTIGNEIMVPTIIREPTQILDQLEALQSHIIIQFWVLIGIEWNCSSRN